MKNTLTVGLSLTSLNDAIGAQCAWVDVTNLAILPPIVNPSDEGITESAVMSSIADFVCRFSGFIESWGHDGDIVKLELSTSSVPARVLSNISLYIEKIVVNDVLAGLYAPQPQAKCVHSLFDAQRRQAEARLKQMLAI